MRLGLYLLWRNWGGGEDVRYVAMRNSWGPRFPLISLVSVYGLQGGMMWLVSLPLLLVACAPAAPLGGLDLAGTVVFAVGLLFESVGDLQLARFRAEAANRGRVMDRGLWRYTRHPNYFGNAVLWWGLFLVALSASPWGWAAILGPALMTFLLLRVSGVPLLERSLRRRKSEYADYVARTSVFVPWPPRRRA